MAGRRRRAWRRLAGLLVGAAFLLSGVAGLVYETVWVQQCAFVLGGTLRASTLVIAAFMGGLSLGSRFLGARADAWARPLQLYAVLELGVALVAPCMGQAFQGVRWARAGLPAMLASPAEDLAIGAVLLVPTALMGGTLPVLCRFASLDLDVPTALGRLYACNCLGAAIGGLAAVFALIPAVGLTLATRTGAAINLLSVVFALSADVLVAMGERRGPGVDAKESTGAARTTGSQPERPDPPAWLPWETLRVYVFLGGFVAMLYEVSLLRMLPLVIGSSVQGFALVVCAFILGSSQGSAMGSLLARHVSRAVSAMGLIQIGIGLSMLATIPAGNLLPEVYIRLRTLTPGQFGTFQMVLFALCFLFMLVPAALCGAAIPLAAAAMPPPPRPPRLFPRPSPRLDGTGASVGRLYAVSTLGNIAGCVAAGLWLVPGTGFCGSIELGAALLIFSGIGLLAREPGGMTAEGGFGIALTSGLVLAFASHRPAPDMLLLTSQIFRLQAIPANVLRQGIETVTHGRTLLFVGEDGQSTVTVDRENQEGVLSLKVNGKPDASDALGDDVTQRLLGQLPMLLHPDPRNVLVVGLGAGVTVGSILTHPVKMVRTVEISPAVAIACHFFEHSNGRCWEDPRMDLRIDDARAYLERDAGAFDCIVSEPSNPWVAGVARLFTLEFFEQARAHLAPGGLMVQWLHGYEMTDDLYALTLRTFRRVFGHVAVFAGSAGDYICVGSSRPIDVDADRIDRRMSIHAVRDDLARIGMLSPLCVLGSEISAQRDVDSQTAAGPLNTDDLNILEYQAPRALFDNRSMIPSHAYACAGRPDGLLWKYLAARHPPADEVVEFVRLFDERLPPVALELILLDLIGREPSRMDARLQLADAYHRAGADRIALSQIDAVAGRMPDRPDVQALRFEITMDLAWRMAPSDAAGMLLAALQAATRWQKLQPDMPPALLAVAEVRYARKEWELANASFLHAAWILGKKRGSPQDASFALLGVAGCQLARGLTRGAVASAAAARGIPRPTSARRATLVHAIEEAIARAAP